jgi:tRNA(adenine34) deaminase
MAQGPTRVNDLAAMELALEQARLAARRGEVPVGAVVLVDGEVVGRAGNAREAQRDPTAHAEILAMRQAAEQLGAWRLERATMVVTLEPCIMCAGALVNARIGRVVIGAMDDKAGALGSLYNISCDPRLNHEFPVVTGVAAEESTALLRRFFEERRTLPRD